MRQDERSSQARLRAAAKSLFAERGYEATAIADITRAAKTSHSQFLKYYSGKEDLRREIIEEQWSELNKAVVLAISTVASPAEKLKLALNMFISFLENDPAFRAILLLEYTATRDRGEIIVSHDFCEFVRVLDDIIDEMKTAGELRPQVDMQAFRSALMGAIEGMMRDQLRAGPEFAAQYSSEQVRSMLSMLVAAACDFHRPEGLQLTSAVDGVVSGSPDDDWIRYYLKLADRALSPSELS